MVDVTVNVDVDVDLDDIDSDDLAEQLREDGWYVAEDLDELRGLANDHLERLIELDDIDDFIEEVSDQALLAEIINRGLELPEEV